MNILKFMPFDKQLHLLGGGCVAGAFLPLGNEATLWAVFIAGFAKEVYDYCDYGKFDIQDLIVTEIGGVLVVGASFLVQFTTSILARAS